MKFESVCTWKKMFSLRILMSHKAFKMHDVVTVPLLLRSPSFLPTWIIMGSYFYI